MDKISLNGLFQRRVEARKIEEKERQQRAEMEENTEAERCKRVLSEAMNCLELLNKEDLGFRNYFEALMKGKDILVLVRKMFPIIGPDYEYFLLLRKDFGMILQEIKIIHSFHYERELQLNQAPSEVKKMAESILTKLGNPESAIDFFLEKFPLK